jgi:hypothetical protein
MRVQTDSDVEVVFAATHACDVKLDPVMKLEGDRACVDWRMGGNATITYVDGTTEIVRQGSPQEYMIENVADAVAGAVSKPMCTLEIARAHVACIQAVHRVASIQTVPARFVSESQEGQRTIAGIEKAVRQVFESGRLFSELGIPFARTA